MKKLLFLGALCMAVGAQAASVAVAVQKPVQVQEQSVVLAKPVAPSVPVVAVNSAIIIIDPAIVLIKKALREAKVKNIAGRTKIKSTVLASIESPDAKTKSVALASIQLSELDELIYRTPFAQERMGAFLTLQSESLASIKGKKAITDKERKAITDFLVYDLNMKLYEIFEHDKTLARDIRTLLIKRGFITE